MPKISEIIAKREELAKTNPNATNVDARKALIGSTPAPQALIPTGSTIPIAPQVTPQQPAPTQPVAQETPPAETPQPVQATPKPQDSFLGDFSGIKKKEPVSPVAPIETTSTQPVVTPQVAPTTAPVVKPEVKTEVNKQVDFNQGLGREQDIQSNLDKFYTSGVTDPEQIKKMSGYDTATPEKKAIIDAFNTAKAPNEDNIFNTLRSGGSVPTGLQNTREYKSAQNRYNKLQTFQRYNTTQVTTALRQGTIIPGTKEYNDIYQDPSVRAKIDEANAYTSINGGYDFDTIGVNKTSELISQNTNVSSALKDGFISEQELSQMTNTDEVSARATDYQTKADTYAKKKQAYDTIETTVRADLDKLGLSSFDSIVRAKIADARSALLPELNIAQTEMNTSYGIYTDAKSQSLAMVDRNIELYNKERSFQQQKEMVQYQADVGISTKQKEFEQKMDQETQLASDPVTGVQNIVSTFAKLGITPDRSNAEMVQEVQQKMAQGMTVGEALSDLQKAFKSKPEYQKQMSLVLGQMSDAEKAQLGFQQDIYKMDKQFGQQTAMQDRTFAQQVAMNDTNFAQDIEKMKLQYNMNDATGRTDFKRDLIKGGMSSEQADAIVRNETGEWNGVSGEKLLYADDGTFIKSTLSETTNPEGGIECAEYVSKITGSQVGSTWEEKTKLNKEPTGSVGSIAVWKPSNSGPFAKYGHAGMIVGEDGDNWIIKSANYNGDGRISTDTVPKSAIKGYRTTEMNTKLGKPKDSPLSDKQYTQYNQATSKFVADPNVKAFESALSQGGDLIASLKSANGPGDVGAVFNFMKTLDPSSTVREGEFALAAKSAGVWEQFKNIPANKLEGTILTDEQRKAFGKLAFEYVKNKGKLYDVKYNDYTRVLKNQGIPESYYPTKMTDEISKYSGEQKSSTEKLYQLTSILSTLQQLAPKR